MARYSRTLLYLVAVLSVLLGSGYGQYRQIVLGNQVSCNMSSVYNQSDGTSLNCTGAINNNTDTHWYPTGKDNPNCAFTDNIKTLPVYWFLNLGQTRTFHKITIYHVVYTPSRYDYTRFMMKVKVSVDGSQIFKYPDDESSIHNPTQITDNLPATGQIIKVERTRSLGNNFLPLCEVEIWECEANRYGNECASICSSNCKDTAGETTCNSLNGSCIEGCKPAGKFSSSLCVDCEAGWYGEHCNQRCNDGCGVDDQGKRPCDKDTGRCSAGCKAGFWGNYCNKTCNRGCVNGTCNKDDGQCQCAPGWRVSCDACDDHHYGDNCDRECGNCTDGAPCDKTTGHCPSCEPGYNPPLCQNLCPEKTYGQNCSRNCGPCADDVTCHPVTGSCPDRCGPGYLGQRCDTECPKGQYGQKCSESCGYCHDDATCDHVDGHCPDRCRGNFSMPLCQAAISSLPRSDVVAGSVTAVVVVIVVAAVAFWWYKRQERRTQTNDTELTSATPEGRVSQHYQNVDVMSSPHGASAETSNYEVVRTPEENYETLRPRTEQETAEGIYTQLTPTVKSDRSETNVKCAIM